MNALLLSKILVFCFCLEHNTNTMLSVRAPERSDFYSKFVLIFLPLNAFKAHNPNYLLILLVILILRKRGNSFISNCTPPAHVIMRVEIILFRTHYTNYTLLSLLITQPDFPVNLQCNALKRS